MTWFVDVSWCSQLTFKLCTCLCNNLAQLNVVLVHFSKRMSRPQTIIGALIPFILKGSRSQLVNTC
uniref:Uncharacterized protein n=1 Tax=Glossina palpalis gambiensis TaxID=67801 RepID=A0A1B0AYJ0_9MUSC